MNATPVGAGGFTLPPSNLCIDKGKALSNSANKPKRILSGMRPTGRLHLGHYKGVLENWLKLQNVHAETSGSRTATDP